MNAWERESFIKNYKLKNKIIFPPISPNWALPNGGISQKLLNFYENIAKGGCGAIIFCGTAISQEAKGIKYSTALYNPSHKEGFIKLVNTIKKYKTIAIIQLMHVGGQGNPAFNDTLPVAPSAFFCEATNCHAKELLIEEIEKIRDDFINSATLSYESGFDGVELHMAHGYLLHEFVSEFFNQRTDKYGGSLENRLRLIIDIITAIKKKYPNKLIGARISAEDYLDEGITFSKNKEIVPLLEKAGLDYLSITAGTYKTGKEKHKAMKKKAFFTYSKALKSITSLPIISVGKILNLDEANEQLINENCDYVAIGRGMIADPFMVSKYYDNESLVNCIQCDTCSYLRHNKTEMSCSQRDFEE